MGLLVSTTPVSVFGLESGATAISSGGDQTCAIVNGGVKCWGLNNVGQLGKGSLIKSFVPVDVISLSSDVTAVAAGGLTTCAIGLNGQLFCWGYKEYGSEVNKIPFAVYRLESGVISVEIGFDHICASVSESTMCWGYNISGQLGNGLSGVYYEQPIPSAVIGL